MQHLSLWQHLERSVEHITVTFTCAVCLFLRLHARDAGLGRDIALFSREPVGHQLPFSLSKLRPELPQLRLSFRLDSSDVLLQVHVFVSVSVSDYHQR